MIIGTLLRQVEEIDLNSMKTVLRHGSGISPPKENVVRARLANVPVAHGRRLLARTCV